MNVQMEMSYRKKTIVLMHIQQVISNMAYGTEMLDN